MTSIQCTICGTDEGDMNLVGEKVLKTLMKAAYEKQENELKNTLKDYQYRGKQVYVHHECRRRLTDLRKKPTGPEPKRLRSSVDADFTWKICCFICSKAIVRKKEKFHQVQTLPLCNSIIECAKARNDDWGEAALTRLGISNDLVAEEAIYQRNCCPTAISDFDFDLYIWIFKSLFGITRN